MAGVGSQTVFKFFVEITSLENFRLYGRRYCTFVNIKQVKITVPKHGQISALLCEVSVQTGVDKDKVSII